MIDFDEELLVIYYSILAYVQRQYGFPVQIGVGYELITGDRFQRYLDGFGIARLRQIRYKYFSDRAPRSRRRPRRIPSSTSRRRMSGRAYR